MCLAYIRGKKDSIQAWANLATAIVTPLALIVTVITLVITSRTSQEQLRISVSSVQGSMIYKLLRDMREIEASYHDGKVPESTIFATMQTVFMQFDLGTIPKHQWSVFDRDFCKFMEDEHLQNSWVTTNHSLYWNKFAAYVDDIVKRAKKSCK